MNTTNGKDKANCAKSKGTSNRTKSRKGRKSYDKRQELEMDKNKRLDASDRDNDPNWYFTSTDLASQAGQLSIQEVLGNGPIVDEATVPTCAVVKLNPSPGISYDMSGFAANGSADVWRNGYVMYDTIYARKPERYVLNDGANLMAFKMYTLMSSFTGRTQQYGPQDLLFMILAISQVAALSEHIRRMFGMALTVNARNRALPKGMIQALGISDVDDFISHLADYRMRFNVQMTRINQVPLLDNIGFIRKCRDIYQKIYVDTDSPMAQNWFYAPYSTWILDEESSPDGTFLKTVVLPYVSKMSDWLDVLSNQIDAILSSSTMQIVYSDLINLANKVNVPTWQFDYLAENYVVLPEYNANAQLQFHNLDVVGIPTDEDATSTIVTNALPTGMRLTPSNNVLQDVNNNCIIYNPGFRCCTEERDAGADQIPLDRVPHDTIVDFNNPNPTLEDRIEALRFSCCNSRYVAPYRRRIPGTGDVHGALTYGMTLSDHYVVSVDLFTYPDTTRTQRFICSDQRRPTGGAGNYYLQVADISKFEDCFLIYDLGSGIAGNLSVKSILGDLNFFTRVPFEYLNRTNRLMFTGLFDFRV